MLANSKAVSTIEAPDGLPRRRAIQGLAGSIASVAALGAMSASAKKNKKKGKKGTLVRFETAEESQSIPQFTAEVPATTVTAVCPDPEKNEAVFATGGGYSTPVPASPSAVDFNIRFAHATVDGTGWEVSYANNTGADQTVTTTVTCAYFKTK